MQQVAAAACSSALRGLLQRHAAACTPEALLCQAGLLAGQRQQARRQSTWSDGLTPADEFLASFTNWEARGIPAAAGVSPAAAGGAYSAASAAPASTAAGVFDLQRMRTLLQQLGDPQAQLPIVHVAGTKGKGSVTAMLAAMLRAAGYRVGAYTSPHLLHLTERIQCPAASAPDAVGGCGGAAMSSEAFEQLVQRERGRIDAASQQLHQQGHGSLSQFEVVTALAIRHFVDQQADIAVIEAGLGGAVDATNVFAAEHLQTAVITPIGLDHVAALGGSLRSIAAAKAGIMRPGARVVLARQSAAEARDVLQAEAERLGCFVVQAEECVEVSAGPINIAPGPSAHCARQGVSITGRLPAHSSSSNSGEGTAVSLSDVQMRLVGAHQQANAATAVAAAMQLRGKDWKLPDEAVRRGLEEAFLPGRFQVARPDAAGPYFILDGAHTSNSAAALADAVRSAFPGQPVALVVAMAADKEHRDTIASLRRMAPRTVVFTSVAIGGSWQRSAPPGTLAAHWQAAAFLDQGRPFRCRELIQASLTSALPKAISELRSQAGGPGAVVVTGSLHAVAAGLTHLGLAT